MKRPTHIQFAAYQQIFDYFNRTLFNNSLPDCMLSFSRRRISSHTLFTTGQWQESAGATAPEISLNLKQMREESPAEVMAMLVRQMVHLWQEIFGQPSWKGYFNREWAAKMADIGLIPSSTGEPGGKEIGQTIKHFIEENGRFAKAFQELPESYLWPFRPTAFADETTRDNSDKTMYQCLGCGTKVWGIAGLGLVCECSQVFVDASGEPKAGLAEKVYRLLAERYGKEGKI